MRKSFRRAILLPYHRAAPVLLLLSLVLVLAAFLRLANLAGNPGWYTDEGTHLDIARHLSEGRVQYLAINQSYLLFARMPLFELMLAGAMRLGGEDIGTLRALTGALGIMSVGMMYWLAYTGQACSLPSPASGCKPEVRNSDGIFTHQGLALLAALLVALYPPAALSSRFGFSYNLLTPLVLLAGIGLLKYGETHARRWLAAASFSVGIGLLSDLWMGAMVAPVLLAVMVKAMPARRWRNGAMSLGLMALPFGLYAALMLIFAPQAFIFDLGYTLSRLNTIPLALQASTLLDNFLLLCSRAPWFLLGLVGLLCLPPRLRNVSLLIFGLPFILLGRATALYSLSFYYLIPLLPFIPLGGAALVWRGCQFLQSRTKRISRKLRILLVACALFAAFVPFAISLRQTVPQVLGRFTTPIDDFLLNPADARLAAAYINAHTDSSDIVIASPALAWLLRGNAADFQMAVAATGHATVHLPANLPPDRFAFDPHLEQARFVVVDNLWRNWAVVHIPEVDAMLRKVENWPVSFSSSEIIVYQSPSQ